MHSASRVHSQFMVLVGLILLFTTQVRVLSAQTSPPPAEKPVEQNDEPVDAGPRFAHASLAGAIAHAWEVLNIGLESSKPEVRISAVTALGTLLPSKQAAADLERALRDPDRDVRLAAVHAAGQMHTRLLSPALRKSLDDPAADVSFTASQVLWQMGDHSGKDILEQVLAGERKSGPGFLKSSLHTANKDLHSPSTLAMIGAEQAAYALMGPFGIGLDAARLMMKSSNNANSARVAAALLLASDKSTSTNRELIASLHDKDYFLRAAGARGLGNFHNKESADALLASVDDSKPLVRYMAAAGYIRSTATGQSSRTRRLHQARPAAAPSK